MKTLCRYGVLLAAIALARVSVLAQVPGPEQVPVKDPDRLEKMGFDRDARNVFVWSKADLGGVSASSRAAAPVLADGQYFGSALLSHLTADTKNCVYSVRVLFAPAGHECVQGGLEVEKLQVAWVRQVSPAPATATFNDVPTSHPFFQFVEALAKSGITGGCNAAPPLYCPDQPLTRGQMAVFLAKALGLQWP